MHMIWHESLDLSDRNLLGGLVVADVYIVVII